MQGPCGTPTGLVQLVGVDYHNGAARLELLSDPGQRQELAPALGAFVRSAADEFPLLRVSISAAGDLLDVPSYFGGSAELVGVLPEHDRRGGSRFADVSLYQIRVGAERGL